MRKILHFFITILSLAYFVSPVTFAQSIFGFGSNANKSTTQTTTAPTSQPNPVKKLSPEDFKKNVTAIDKQTKTQLRDELNQQLSAKQPTPIQQPATPPASSGPLMGPSTTNTPPAAQLPPTIQPAPTQIAPQAPQAQQQVAPPQGTSGTSNINKPSGPNDQIYSGFQAPQQNATPSNTNSGQQGGGGWNIHY